MFEVLCEEVGLAPLDLREALPQRGRHPQVELLPGRAHHPPPGGRPAALTGSRRSPSYPPYAHHACSAGGERIKKGVRTGRAGPGELPRHAPYLATTRGARRRRFAPEVRRPAARRITELPPHHFPAGRRGGGARRDGRGASRLVSTMTRRQLPDAPAVYGPDFADVTRRVSGLGRRCYIMRPLSFQRRTLVVGRAGAG